MSASETLNIWTPETIKDGAHTRRGWNRLFSFTVVILTTGVKKKEMLLNISSLKHLFQNLKYICQTAVTSSSVSRAVWLRWVWRAMTLFQNSFCVLAHPKISRFSPTLGSRRVMCCISTQQLSWKQCSINTAPTMDSFSNTCWRQTAFSLDQSSAEWKKNKLKED